MKRELMVTGSGNGRAGRRPSSLEVLITVTSGVFLVAVRLDELIIEALNKCFQHTRAVSLLDNDLAENCKR